MNDELNRWVPIRTRYDKTQFMKNMKKFGNYKTIADNVWKSIMDDNSEDVIYSLANDNLYNKVLNDIRNKVNVFETSKNKTLDNTYYKKQVNIGKNMRNFHNYIKSQLIYIYCKNKKVLEKI